MAIEDLESQSLLYQMFENLIKAYSDLERTMGYIESVSRNIKAHPLAAQANIPENTFLNNVETYLQNVKGTMPVAPGKFRDKKDKLNG